MLQNYLVILNPKSGDGGGQAALEKLRALASSKGTHLELLITESAGHASDFLQQHSLKDIDGIISIGGDGSLNEIVNGLLTRKDDPQIPMGVIPVGTGNSLMKDLGCRNAEEAIAEIFSGKRSSLDIFKVEMDEGVRYGFNMIGCGLPAAINHYAETSRRFKKQRYNVGALKAIFHYKPTGFSLSHDEAEEILVSDFIIASNTKHVASGMKIAPHAKLDDGLLDVVILKPFNRLSLLPLFYKLCKGTQLQDPKVITKQLKTFTISAPWLAKLNIDGEEHDFKEVQVSILTRRINLLHQCLEDN